MDSQLKPDRETITIRLTEELAEGLENHRREGESLGQTAKRILARYVRRQPEKEVTNNDITQALSRVDEKLDKLLGMAEQTPF